MNSRTVYKPLYEQSWALVIGINDYQIASPLGFARQDAEAFAAVLTEHFGFPEKQVTVLVDQNATREQILSSFMRFSKEDISPDDRITVFFAGHGHTRTGRRGEVGYLVPVDGDPENPITLIRWDDLTRNADLIEAKHILFVMDACYGGLAVHRAVLAGSSRFLKDMLQRYSRQVLTAGKADETVADSGGPRPNHSMFTGHLLDALEGNASDSNGIISANAVMAYVYDRVGKDPSSQQSPHFGFFDGDGDFIFTSLNTFASGDQNEKEGADVLIQVPPVFLATGAAPDEPTLAERIKDYLSDSRFRIRLDDLIGNEIRTVLHLVRDPEFLVPRNTVTPAEFAMELRKYEDAISRLNTATILIARWGEQEHQPLLERIIARLADANDSRSGNSFWLGIRWYPILVLMYSGGIAALSAHNYTSLATLLTTTLGNRSTGQPPREAVVSTVQGILEVERAEMFKRLPGYERNYVPRSEYLLKTLQPEIEDLLFLGSSYEDLFDRFEVLFALTYADIENRSGHHLWGPPGRFGWKNAHGAETSPFHRLLKEAEQAGASWAPLTSGLFAGSLNRFKEIAELYNQDLLSKLQWN